MVVTQKMCNEAVQSNPEVLAHVPAQFVTQEMCNEAVQSDPLMLAHVPDWFVTQEMCNEAVQSNPEVHMPADVPAQFVMSLP